MGANAGIIALSVLGTIGVLLLIVSGIWITYLIRKHEGKQDALTDYVNEWVKKVNGQVEKTYTDVAGNVDAKCSTVNDVNTLLNQILGKVNDVHAQTAKTVAEGLQAIKDELDKVKTHVGYVEPTTTTSTMAPTTTTSTTAQVETTTTTQAIVVTETTTAATDTTTTTANPNQGLIEQLIAAAELLKKVPVAQAA